MRLSIALIGFQHSLISGSYHSVALLAYLVTYYVSFLGLLLYFVVNQHADHDDEFFLAEFSNTVINQGL